MPILTALPEQSEWVEPDEVPRAVVIYGFAMVDFGGIALDFHQHRKGQLLLVQRGALSCEVACGLWIVPPRSAIWIPGGAMHAVKATGALEGYHAFIDPAIDTALPNACCAVAVSPLLRELLIRAANLPLLYEDGGVNARLVAVLLDEIAAAKVEDLHLPMPTDTRLRRIAAAMMAAPSERATLQVWAKRAGLSQRTLERLISQETGMSFGRWRQQLCVVLAVDRLAGGASLHQVAADLGYASLPSFVTMFRNVLGTSPGRYMAERRTIRD